MTGFTTEDARPPLPVPDPVVDTRSLDGDRIRLLLVEADQAAARTLQHELREDDPAFEVATVDRLDAALDHLGAAATDAVVVDLSLPDSRGLETLSALRAGALALPIVVLAGGDDEELALRALGVGASDHLVKGRVTSDLVARAVRYAIERERLLAAERESRRDAEVEPPAPQPLGQGSGRQDSP